MKRGGGSGAKGCLASLLVLAGCAVTAPERLPPGCAAGERVAQGERSELPLAQLFVPDGFVAPADGRVPLFVHFQGGVTAAVAGELRPGGDLTERGVPIGAELHVGGLHLYRFDEATPGIHVDCLYFVPEMVRRHVPAIPAVAAGATADCAAQ